MADTSIEQLNIDITSSIGRADKAIDRLTASLNQMSTAIGSFDTSKFMQLSSGISNFSNSMKGFTGVKTTEFTRLAKGLEKLSNVNYSGISNLSRAMSKFTTDMSGVNVTFSSITGLSKLVRGINQFGYASTTKALNNIPQLSNVLKGLITEINSLPKVSANTISLVNALANLSSQGRKVNSVMNSFNTRLNTTGRVSKVAFTGITGLASKIYSFTFLMRTASRVVSAFWTSFLEPSMDYIEAFNYYNVIMGKIGDEFSSQFEQYGYDSAEAYVNSFSDRLNALTEKMTGFSIGNNGVLSISGQKNLGLDTTKIVQYESQIASVTNSLGLAGETSINTSKAITMVATDWASLANTDFSTAMENFQSGLIGQSRALYKYGIDITNATLQTYAYSNGIDKSLSEMTQAEKMQLRVLAILDQSKVAYGDLANTIASPANQFRILKEQIAASGRMIGELFLPAVSALLPYVNALVLAFKQLIAWIGSLFGLSDLLSSLNDSSSMGYSTSGLDDLADSADDATDSLDSATDSANALSSATSGIDELNIISPTSSSSSDSSGVSAGTIDLSDEIADALANYEDAWNTALANSTNKAQEIADSIVSAFQSGDYKGIGTYISTGITDALNGIDWESVYSVASGFGTGFADFFNGLITPALFYATGRTIANSLNTAIYATLSFGEEFDFVNLGDSIASGINGFFQNFDFKSLAGDVNVWVGGIADMIAEAVKNIDWKTVIGDVGDFIGSLDAKTITIIFSAITLKYLGKALTSGAFSKAILKSLSAAMTGAGFTLGSSLSGAFLLTATAAVTIQFIQDFSEWKNNINEYGWDEGRTITANENSANPYNDDSEYSMNLQGAYDSMDEFTEKVKAWQANNRASRDEEEQEVQDWSDAIGDKVKNKVDDFSTWWNGNIVAFWNNNVSPWFTPQKWTNLFSNVETSAANKWDDIVSWWENSAISTWWSEDVTPWFSTEKWTELADGILQGIETKWSEVSDWWSGTAIVSWWDDNVAPWFTTEKWYELADGFKTGIENKWNDLSEWWGNTALVQWWENHVAPWFTLTKWFNLADGFKTGISNKWGDMTEQWKTNISSWWQNNVAPWFTKEKWLNAMGGIKDAFKDAFKNAANSAIGMLNNLVDKINDIMNFDWGWTNPITGEHYGGSVQIFTLPHIDTFATGGFPNTGEMFIANEAGPELVGTIGGSTAVVNNDQIVESVSAGVADGVLQAMNEGTQNSLLQEAVSLLNQILDKDTTISLDGRTVNQQLNARSTRDGYSFT